MPTRTEIEAVTLLQRFIEDWPQFATFDDDVNGADLVEYVGVWMIAARRVVKRANES